MQNAMEFHIEDLSDKSRLFNVTDELLTMSAAYPSYQEKFKQLNNLLLRHVMNQRDARGQMGLDGVYYVHGIGVATCHFESLSVYHFIRMSQSEIVDTASHFNQVKKEADELYLKNNFRTGALSAKEEDIRLFHFHPNNRLSYRVDHMMQVLHHNRYLQQQYYADMRMITPTGD